METFTETVKTTDDGIDSTTQIHVVVCVCSVLQSLSVLSFNPHWHIDENPKTFFFVSQQIRMNFILIKYTLRYEFHIGTLIAAVKMICEFKYETTNWLSATIYQIAKSQHE